MGKNLLLVLSLGLSCFVLILDGMVNRIFSIGFFIFLFIFCGLVIISLGYWVIFILKKLKVG